MNGPPVSQSLDDSSLRPLLHQLSRHWWSCCWVVFWVVAIVVLKFSDTLLLIPFPFIVWGADELRKWVIRTRSSRRAPAVTPAPAA